MTRGQQGDAQVADAVGTGRDYTRRRFVGFGGAAVAALALGACSGGDDTELAAADSPATPSGGTSESDVATRTIEHDKGELVVPADPKRLVTCEGTMNIIALGVIPIGARNIESDTRAFPERADELGEIFDLGGQDLDLEQVLALEPDVIIATAPNYDDRYGQMSKIAPTVMYRDDALDRKLRWDDELEYFATVLGKEERAAELLSAYRDRCEEFKAAMGDRLATTRISVLRVSSDSLKIYTGGSFAGGVLLDAGCARPENQDIDAAATNDLTNGSDQEGFDISPERLREAEGDVIFRCVSVPVDPAKDDDKTRATRANAEAVSDHPLWNQLAAVQDGQAFTVGGHWNGETILDAEKMLDDLFQYLVPDGADDATSSPAPEADDATSSPAPEADDATSSPAPS